MEKIDRRQQAEFLKQTMRRLPFITSDLNGIGGVIKAKPEHFEVQEQLPYAACGEGEHVFVTLRRKGWNTADVGAALAALFNLNGADVGWGGRKDKQAVTTQTFSLRLPIALSLPEISARLADLPFEILDLQRHRNKIKTGHVAANRFRILLSQVAPEAGRQAEIIAEALRRRGLPNFYGEQRFGIEAGNIDRALQLLSKRRAARGNKEIFLVSVFQSALFNVWLAQRMADGRFHAIVGGDVAQKTDTGGLFVVTDAAEAAERFQRGAIVYTGPIFGSKMKSATEQAGALEAELLHAFELDLQLFKRLRAPGSRRAAVLFIQDLQVRPAEEGLLFEFTLPPGAYATVVMREFMRAAG